MSKIKKLSRLFLFLILLTGSMAVVQPSQSYAEEPAAGEAAPAEGAGGTVHKSKTLWDYIKHGGVIMMPLFITSAVCLAFIIDCLVRLRKPKVVPPQLFASLRQAMSAGNYQEAWTVCKANPCYLANVMRGGLERVGKGQDAFEFGLEEQIARESSIIRTKTSYLSVIGVVSPMIGLTGTVFGMIKAFEVIGSKGVGDPGALSAAIGEVLVATAAGLLISIPAFVCYYIFRNQASALLIHVQEHINRLSEDIPFRELTGIKIGENFSAATGPAGVESRMSRRVQAPMGSGTVPCPTCGAPVTPGAPSCTACNTVLQWG
ncbi:MAG: MotA/TolQ/ExbB proton channel family protein [Verrucomicrobiota bacterium]|nr:MotA/TolQ/ExbB proton channel family protein [Verrucomicrobiota bacterium]